MPCTRVTGAMSSKRCPRRSARNPTISRELLAFVRGTCCLNIKASASADEQAEQRRFVGKFQQVTAPVMEGP